MQRPILIVLGVLLVGFSYRLWLSNEGMREVWRLGSAMESQTEQNGALRARNGALEAEVLDLKQGLDAIEERARQDLGMTRSGETFFQVVEKTTGENGTAN